MLPSHIGLTGVPTHLLERAFRTLVRGELSAPIDINGLACVGLQDVAPELLNSLRGLDERAVRAVLVAVIAERRA